jgi:hypothetical protein
MGIEEDREGLNPLLFHFD